MMDDSELIDQEDEKASSKKKKSGEGTGSPSDKIVVTPELSASMARFGVTMEQLKQIIKNWSHLGKGDLAKALGNLSRDIARASAHVLVDFKGCFSLMTDFILSQRSKPVTPTSKIGIEDKKIPKGPR